MIEIKNLVKRYGKHTAVDNLSFTVQTGKVVGFLGPNGAGKSTTMNMITGYIAPTSGTILIDGINILEEPEEAKKHIGYLPEIPPLYTDLRVREYLQFVAELKKVPAKERDKAVYQAMKKTVITDVSERLIRHLSKGYRQRVGFAGAMIGEPDILILDEPTVGLDPAQIIEIRELIRDLSKDHTVLLSSHIMQEISAVCDQIIIINQGKMIISDTPENLTEQMFSGNQLHLKIKGNKTQILNAIHALEGVDSAEAKEETEEGCEIDVISTKDVREDVFFAMSEICAPILEMRTASTSLEEVFLALTEGDSNTAAPQEEKPAQPEDENEEKGEEKE